MLPLTVMGIEDFHLSPFPSELLGKLNGLQVQVLAGISFTHARYMVIGLRLSITGGID